MNYVMPVEKLTDTSFSELENLSLIQQGDLFQGNEVQQGEPPQTNQGQDSNLAQTEEGKNQQIQQENEKKNSFAENGSWLQENSLWKNVLIGIWGMGSAVVIGCMVFCNGRLYQALKRNRILLDSAESKLPVYLVEGLPTPCLFGRAIYIPTSIIMQERKLHHIVLHEETHFRHGDGFWGIIRGICVAIYWWNPLVWISAYFSMQDCEYACDEAVLYRLGEQERISYGETILSLVRVKKFSGDYFTVASTMTKGGRQMEKRIRRIVHERKGIVMAGGLVVLLLILGMAGTITAGNDAIGAEESQNPENALADTESLATESQLNSSESEIQDESEEEWEEVKYGWAFSFEKQVLRVNSDSGEKKTVLEISDLSRMTDFVDCSFVNEQTAFISYYSEMKQQIAVEYTKDAGKTWSQSYISYDGYGGANLAHISFGDEQTGYVLYGSDPAGGKMTKVLYRTKDGAGSFEEVAVLDMRNHPNDMLFFTENNGFIVTQHYGEEPYLYQTLDGGITWKPVWVYTPEDIEFNYINGVSLELEENSDEQAALVLEAVGNTETVYLEYVTKNSGETWELVDKTRIEG